MKQLLLLLVLSALLLAPLTVRATPQTGSWQIYTMAHGMRDQYAWRVAPDGRGGLWVGHVAGGRGVNRPGGLSHLRAAGSARVYDGTDEPFASCPTVSMLALAPDNTLWMQLSGIHDYGSTDYLGRCTANYGGAIGFIGTDGVPQMPAQDDLPDGITYGLAVDPAGRPWVGTESGIAVRNADGSWQTVDLWEAEGTRTTIVRAVDNTIMAGSSQGDVVRITPGSNGADAVQPVASFAGERAGVVDITRDAVLTGAGVFRLDPSGGQWQQLVVPTAAYVPRLVADGETLWLGTSDGLYRLSGADWLPIRAGETPLPHDDINDMATDLAGDPILWIGTGNGAARLNFAGPSPNPDEARRAFNALWQRTDGQTAGSWVWGPQPWRERYEPYVEAPGGSRFVRYYDKTRMELTYPGENADSPWYVTNGLLVMEMVRGVPQLGDTANRYEDVCPPVASSPCRPPFIPVVGDPTGNDLAPRYGDFEPLRAPRASRIGQPVATTYTHAEQFAPFVEGTDTGLGTPATAIAVYDETTGHNIPGVLWDYMQQQPVDWLYLFGHPITAPVWVQARVGGVEQWVLVQLFERRVLTYTPANAPAWQVEMGNVGQHYYRWRYQVYSAGSAPWE